MYFIKLLLSHLSYVANMLKSNTILLVFLLFCWNVFSSPIDCDRCIGTNTKINLDLSLEFSDLAHDFEAPLKDMCNQTFTTPQEVTKVKNSKKAVRVK